MMCFKAILLVSAIVCLISAEYIPLKERIFKCKIIPFKKHHSILESILPSIISPPFDSAVPDDFTVPAGGTTFGTEPVPVPTAVPVEPNPPPQEVLHPPQPEVQYPPQQEAQNPPQQEVQYPPQPEVQYPVPQQEGQPPAQQEVQNTPPKQPLYPPQHEGQPPAQPHVEQILPSSNGALYPPQHEGQRPAQPHAVQVLPSSNEGLYPPQHNGQYYQLQNTGMYYPPPNYQGFTTNNVPINYPVYGQNVLRSVKSLDGQTYPLFQRSPYRVNMFIRQPSPYFNAPPVYGQYAAAPQFNYVPQVPRTAQALTGKKAKSP